MFFVVVTLNIIFLDPEQGWTVIGYIMMVRIVVFIKHFLTEKLSRIDSYKYN